MKRTSINMLILPALLLGFAFSSCSTKYYVVRHADREDDCPDAKPLDPLNPHLSAAGQARAQTLLDTILPDSPAVIFATNNGNTPWNRTWETAQPTADAMGKQIQPYSSGMSPDSLAGFIARLNKINSKAVLIVGHSDTVDDLVNGLLGKGVMNDIPGNNYDTLIIVKRPHCTLMNKTRVHTRYGAESPVPCN